MEKSLTRISRRLLTAVLLLVTTLAASLPVRASAERSASLMDQPVTVKFADETMDASLEKLKKAVNTVAFNYKMDDVAVVKVKANSFVNKPLKDVLNALTANTQLEYREKYGTIIISHKKVVRAPEKITVTGTVTDKDGPLAGVAVHSKTSTAATSTDINGNFKITVEKGEVLVFSSIGYKSREAIAGQSPINVNLEADVTGLNAVVVVGYGTQKKSEVTGSVGSLKVSNTKDRSVGSVTEMLQGQIAGVTVINESGDPTATPSIRLRGRSSFNNEGPLTVVDGTIYNGGPLDPNDIESIDVLKDSYAAIYGARAAGGVILITTKRGKKGQTNLDISVKGGVQNSLKILQALNAAEYADAMNTAYDNAGKKRVPAFDATLNPDSRITRTNWPNALFRTGHLQEYNLNISGGGEKSTFYISGSYRKNDAILLNTNSVRYNFRANSDHQIKDWLKIGESMTYSYSNGQGANTSSAYTGAILSAIFYPPNASIYNADGSFGGVPAAYAGQYGDVINPVAYLKRLDNSTAINSFTINPYVEVSLFKGLKFRSNLGITKNLGTVKNFSTRVLEPGKKFFDNFLYDESYTATTILAEQTLTYDRVFGNSHHVSALAGYTYQNDKYDFFGVSTDNFLNEDEAFRYLINGTLNPSTTTPLTGNLTQSALISYFGKIGYDYQGKYFINGIIRRDATSKLSKQNRSATYPGVSAGWLLSKEPFFPADGLISFAKLRASYGQSGNLAGLNDDFPTSVSLTKTAGYLGSPATVISGYGIDGIANPNLKWEKATQTDIGFDLNFLKDKFSLTGDVFVKNNTQFIFKPPVAAVYGVSNPPYVNGGKIQNKGVELAVKYQDNAGLFHYNLALNGAYIKNKIIDILPGVPSQPGGPTVRDNLVPILLQQGSPLYSFYGYRTAGLFQTQDEINNYKSTTTGTLIQANAKPGDIKFVDLNGDGKLDVKDKTILGTPFPKFTYGFTANLSYGPFDLSVFLQGVYGNKIFNAVKYTGLNASIQNYNLLADAKKAWTPSNTNTNIPRLSASDDNGNFGNVSDFYVENGSYLRIKNATLGYTLPKTLLTKIGIRTARVFANAQNLATFTKYTGLDPEVGINQNGVDLGLYPQSRIILIGINVGL